MKWFAVFAALFALAIVTQAQASWALYDYAAHSWALSIMLAGAIAVSIPLALIAVGWKIVQVGNDLAYKYQGDEKTQDIAEEKQTTGAGMVKAGFIAILGVFGFIALLWIFVK